ncbi:MAG: hypothetical protein LBS63_02005 [Prevotellaceae bacterium]|jgi:hypothetical protein|nr:hypothetical protein [Prevotellaceae bacterium]
MKRIIFIALLLLPASPRLSACEIRMDVQDDLKKDTYLTGDTVVVLVQVQLTHRVCPEGIKRTKFTYENLKIAGATEWKEVKPGLYTRRIKATITADKNGNAKIIAVRTCDKEGGHSVCTFKKTST